MQVLLQIAEFSLQTDGSGQPVLTKGKRPKRWPIKYMQCQCADNQHQLDGLSALVSYAFISLTTNCLALSYVCLRRSIIGLKSE